MQGNTLRANVLLRFVLLPLVDAHLPAPSLRAPRAAPGPRPRNLAGSHQPGLTPSAPPSPPAPGTLGVSPTVLRYLDFRPGLGPDLRDIAAQYSSDNPNPESQERDVIHSPVQCPAAPRDVCCDIACFGPRFTSWLEISQHTSPGLRGSRCVWVSTVLLYLKIWPRIRALILQNAAHNSRREDWAALNREGVDKQCETGPARTGTQLHF